MGALDTPALSLDLRRNAVVGDARSKASVPHGRAAGRAIDTSKPSVRGTILAALGAITSLGCAAAIGLVSIAGSPAPKSPGTNQPVSTVQAHLPAAP